MKQHKIRNLLAAGASAAVLTGVGVAVAQTPPAAPPPGGTFAQRLEQRKRERNVQMIEKDQKRLAQRCVAIQGDVREIQQKATPIVNNRAKVYQRIDAKLWVTIGQLKLADRDTFDLEKERGGFTERAAAFQVTAANYLQTLDDMIVINCQADIVGFKALLDTARLYQGQVRTQSADIRSYVIDTIKPTLADHATALQPRQSTEDE